MANHGGPKDAALPAEKEAAPTYGKIPNVKSFNFHATGTKLLPRSVARRADAVKIGKKTNDSISHQFRFLVRLFLVFYIPYYMEGA